MIRDGYLHQIYNFSFCLCIPVLCRIDAIAHYAAKPVCRTDRHKKEDTDYIAVRTDGYAEYQTGNPILSYQQPLYDSTHGKLLKQKGIDGQVQSVHPMTANYFLLSPGFLFPTDTPD